MVDSKKNFNHYDTLKVSPSASQAEIKQAYRRLVKLFHPDTNQDTSDKEQIIKINAAYEILGDNHSRLNYDQELRERSAMLGGTPSQKFNSDRQQRTTSAQKQYQARRKSGKDADEQVEEWLRLVYQPVNRLLCNILSSLEEELDELAADPFDDELIDEFQEYLINSKEDLKQAQTVFRSRPNPPSLARSAAHLYYSLNQVADGLEELCYFPLNYDERYLHTGQELFRIARRLHSEAQVSVNK